MHYYLIEVCILTLSIFFSFSLAYFLCSTVSPHSLPPSFGELIWPLQTGLLAENGSWTAEDNRAVLEGVRGSFWVRNTTEVQMIHSKELLSVPQHTVPGLLGTSQVSQLILQARVKFRHGWCSFSTKSQKAFLIPIYLHFTQCSLNVNHYLFHN